MLAALGGVIGNSLGAMSDTDRIGQIENRQLAGLGGSMDFKGEKQRAIFGELCKALYASHEAAKGTAQQQLAWDIKHTVGFQLDKKS